MFSGGPTETPTPVTNGAVRARAHVVSSGASTCAEVEASTDYLNESISITPDGDPVGAQSVAGGSYASWTVAPDTYTIVDSIPSGYILKLACWDSGPSPITSGTGISATVAGSQTVTWELGYSLGSAWFQAGGGGDVYAQSSLASYIPPGTLPRYFSLDGAGNTSGFVQYGTSYDFDSSSGLLGGGYISSDGWLANDTVMQPDYYAIMYKRFGSPATSDYPGGTILTSPPASRSTPYYVTGDPYRSFSLERNSGTADYRYCRRRSDNQHCNKSLRQRVCCIYRERQYYGFFFCRRYRRFISTRT